MSDALNNPKYRVAAHLAQQVESGMTVGLGTGSTANCFIQALAQRQREDGLDITTVSSSAISATLARKAGLRVISIESLTTLDWYVDGADEVTPELTLLKGRGQDLVREKLLASAASSFHVLIDESKRVTQLGEKFPIPVEVLPEAWQLVTKAIEQQQGKVTLRLNAAGDNVAVTAQGNYVLDCQFEQVDALSLNQFLDAQSGVMEHGIFFGIATSVLVGTDAGVEVLTR
jgi:ribose 5-phosphate isomerase A